MAFDSQGHLGEYIGDFRGDPPMPHSEVSMPLTDLQIKNFTPEPGKKQRIFDGQGLYLEVSPTGRTYWRLKYRYARKEKVLALGVYPEVGLKDARLGRDEARNF